VLLLKKVQIFSAQIILQFLFLGRN